MGRRFSISLHDINDAEIIAWIDGLPSRSRSAAIRDVLRGHVNGGQVGGDVGLADQVADRVVERLAQAGQLAQAAGRGVERVDADVIDNLGRIGG